MIVFDTSTLVGAAIGRGSVPDRAVRHAFASDRVAVSEATLSELLDALARPRLARFIDPELRDEVLSRRSGCCSTGWWSARWSRTTQQQPCGPRSTAHRVARH